MGNKSEYEILQTLYRTHVRPLPHCPEWDHFGAFREWAEKTWSYGMALRKKDLDGIWCPENAEFVDVVPIPSTERVRMAKQWDIARVRIARMLGAKLAQAKHPCENCGIRETCEKPCEARLDWWNIRIAKLRKELGL